MNVEKEIGYRGELLQKVYDGGKLTKEEREWLQTHIVYSEKFGFPMLSRDMIQIEKRRKYHFRIEFVSCTTKTPFSPIFVIPLGKGGIDIDGDVTDFYGNVQKGINIKVLSTRNSSEKPVVDMHVISDTGLLGVCYECETSDHRGAKYMADSSSFYPLAMKKMVMDENKVMYFCKDVESDSFDKYVFTVEFYPEND
ncbi:MAG: hypothetical protein IKM61_06435 [Eubacteriaceae bacterium]|nr:hypothetical protein [Eubacteriaceae bacterium]